MWRETFYSQSVHALLSGKNRANDLKHVKELLQVLQFWGKRHVVPLLRIHYLFIIFLLCVFFAIWSCCALLSQSTKISRMTFSSTERRNRRDCFLRVIMPKRAQQKRFQITKAVSLPTWGRFSNLVLSISFEHWEGGLRYPQKSWIRLTVNNVSDRIRAQVLQCTRWAGSNGEKQVSHHYGKLIFDTRDFIFEN